MSTRSIEDTSVFQGVVEFEAGGQKFRAIRTGGTQRGWSGVYRVHILDDGAYIARGHVQVGSGPKSELASRIYDAWLDLDDDDGGAL